MSNTTTEFEERIMIDENQYREIVNFYSEKNPHLNFIKNQNFYFDNEKCYLTNHHITLRARIVDEIECEFTCKIKEEKGDREISDTLNAEKKQLLPDKNILPDGHVKNFLDTLDQDITGYKKIASLTTIRLEINENDHLFVVDKNSYGQSIDYNIEVESSSVFKAQKYLKKYCKQFKIEINKNQYIGKARRAIKASIEKN
ncbi:MAG TPA: CYTH domain-containing protein [Erysipelotrichaceae bacterium]|nr:CYTH domain-containing protein [Erysipelotrichaceae bacterium]